MKQFKSIKTIKVPKELTEKALKFALEVTGTTNYSDCHQTNQDKVVQDHYISKIGEEAVRLLYEGMGCSVVGPDYEIYHGRGKSWASDLFIDGTDLAVKCQSASSSKKYGTSWLFQCSEYRKDTILEKPDAYVSFVVCQDPVAEAACECQVYPSFKISQLEFGEPVLPHLRGKKKVVYANTLKV